jgi:Holliday junction resolvase RusA-like endonuclease
MKIESVITILGEPTAWPRVKRGKDGHCYDPSARAKESFAVQCLAQWRPDDFPSDRKFTVDASFYCAGKEKDGDNLFKFIADALEGLYWINDRQIKDHQVHVRDNSDNPRTVLMIGFLEIGK